MVKKMHLLLVETHTDPQVLWRIAMNPSIISTLALFAAMLVAETGHAAPGTSGNQSPPEVPPLIVPVLLPAVGGTVLPLYIPIAGDITSTTGHQEARNAHAEVKSDILLAFTSVAAKFYVIPRPLSRLDFVAMRVVTKVAQSMTTDISENLADGRGTNAPSNDAVAAEMQPSEGL